MVKHLPHSGRCTARLPMTRWRCRLETLATGRPPSLSCSLYKSRLQTNKSARPLHQTKTTESPEHSAIDGGVTSQRQRRAASPRITTFTPMSSTGSNHEARAQQAAEPASFLQQKAKLVMDRRAEAASSTSMTSAEKAAFDNIWKLFEPASSPQVQPEPKQTDPMDTDFRNLLELFESLSRSGESQDLATHPSNGRLDDPKKENASQKRSHARMSGLDGKSTDVVATKPTSTSDRRLSETQKIDVAALALVEDISWSFDAAIQPTNPDSESAMWEVCEQKIFPLTKLLIPARSKLTPSPPSVEEAKQTTPTHPLIPSGVPLIPLLSKVYPATLLLALRLYKRHYPTSPYCLALLPHIKSLGPTSYVLGANTHFYNTLMSIRWHFYSDLDEISQLLAEMDRTGLEYDTGTTDLLKHIAQERDQDLHDEPYNHPVHARDQDTRTVPKERGSQWWKTPLIDRSWTRFQTWRVLVARRLEAKGLGEVMREGSIAHNHDGSRIGEH